MREIKAHFTCDRCKAQAVVVFRVQTPDEPPNWLRVGGPHGDENMLCPACAAAWRAFFKNVILAPAPEPPAKTLCSCPSANSCYRTVMPPNLICRRDLPATVVLHRIPPEAT